MDASLEKRRLQEIGGSLFISLPQDWIKTLQLRKGTEILIEKGPNNELHLSPNKPAQTDNNTTQLTFGPHLYRQLISQYLHGTSFITVQNQGGFSKKQRQEIVDYTNRLMNVEVVEETATKITLQHFHTTDAPLKLLIQRMYFLTHSMFLDLATAKTQAEVESILDRDATVGKIYLNIIMHLRSLLTGKLLTKEYTLVEILDLRLLIKQIELIGDEIKQLAKELLAGTKCKTQDITFLAQRYEQAFKAYLDRDVPSAATYWDTEKKDKQRVQYNPCLLRIYAHIKDISDLVI